MRLWINNTDDQPDAILTMTLMGFIVILFKVVLGGVTLNAGASVINFGTIDGAVIAAILTPTLGAYVARRYTDRKFVDSKEP